MSKFLDKCLNDYHNDNKIKVKFRDARLSMEYVLSNIRKKIMKQTEYCQMRSYGEEIHLIDRDLLLKELS